MNTALLEKIKLHILEEPRRLNMSMWNAKVSPDTSPCGTVGCIAGWAIMLTGHDPDILWDVGSKATSLLGLTWEQAQRLFYPENWPGRFGHNFWELPNETQAMFAAKMIDDIIAESKAAP